MSLSKDYLIFRNYIYSLEFVRSEMYVKLHEFLIKNPTFDATDSYDKINRIAAVQNFLNVQFEVIEQLKKEIQLKDITIKTLQAKNNQLENQQVIK